ncbi:ABC transporter substrate-binding protein [Brevibacillus parabrevis]|uniref:peptide ABC transporter substrate-binding protein n=1 Tax=Brevibacillus parabrevis TaxID=54914 RepID=UPI0007ABE2BE|nr:peptide ABC transporter substrate-binding protein [Brevibacillus parabrevis]KZE52291.1 ABC transporter substrate-binding protein [Brevibacillus parabrevis]
MKKKLLTAAALLMLVVPGLAACSKDTPAASDTKTGQTTTQAAAIKQEVTANLKGEPYTLDPAFASDSTSYWVIDHLYEGLYRYNNKGELVEGAAEKIEISPDGKTYTFHIRKGLKWSNGDALTAKDFEFAWKRVLDPQTAAYEPSALYYIEGAEEYNTGKGPLDKVKISTPDEYTLVVGLKNPASFFPKVAIGRPYLPVNPKVVQADKNWAGEAKSIVTNGAYKVGAWEHNNELTLAKNDQYWEKDAVTMETVHFKMVNDATTAYQMYKTGKFDLIDTLPTDVIEQEKGKEEYKAVADFGVYTYTFNTSAEPFNNAKIRRAFSMAIDREAITQNITKGDQKAAYGYVAYGVTTPSGKDFRDEVAPYYSNDPAEAKKLLEEGMKEQGWSTLPAVTLKYSTGETHKKVAEALQEMFRKNLGVEIKLEHQEWKTYIDTYKQMNFQIARMGWTGSYLDPLAVLELYTSKSSSNFTKWENAKYDQLIEQARVEQDQEKRNKLLHEAEDVLMAELPIIPVYFYTQNYLNSKKIEGIQYSVTREPDFRQAKKVAE